MIRVSKIRTRLLPLLVFVLISMLVVSACGTPAEPDKPAPAPAPAPSDPDDDSDDTEEIVSARPQVTIGMTQEPRGFGLLTAQIAASQVEAALNLGLTVRNSELEILPAIAEELPSLDAGTWVVNEDGTMKQIWKIRQGVKWHDGTEVTAHDFKFGWEVARDPELPIPQRMRAPVVSEVIVEDDYTFTAIWDQFWPFGDEEFVTGTMMGNPLPRHILETVYNEDKEGFINHPYWTREFIGTGAYRLKEWEEGSHITLEANPDFIFGEPRIQTVVFKFIPDSSTLASNIMGGDVDVTITPTIGLEAALTLSERWQGGEVDIVAGFGWDWIALQQEDPKLTDVRVRQALLHAIDREGMIEHLFDGAFTIAHTPSLSTRHPWYNEDIDREIVRYPFDMDRAAQLMAEAGWTPGADGILRNDAGEQFELSLRTVSGDGVKERAQAVIQESWTELGVKVEIDNKAPALIYDRDHLFKLAWPGAFLFNFGGNPRTIPTHYHSRDIPTEENSWSGANLFQYANPRVDELVEMMETEPREDRRTEILAEMLSLVTQDVANLPLWYKADVATIKDGLENVKPTGTNDAWTWNIHEWYWSK